MPGSATQRDFFEPTTPAPCGARIASQEIFQCEKCGFDRNVDTPIHDGRWLRRDCARCKFTAGFPVWHGERKKLRRRVLTRGGGLTTPSAEV